MVHRKEQIEMGRIIVVILLAALTLACGSGELEETTEGEEAITQIAQPPRTEKKATLCDHIPQEAVASAFGGQLVVTSISSADEINCLYNLGLSPDEPLEAAQLIVHKVPPAMYDTEKENWQGKDNYEDLPGVGREAHVLNKAQVNVLVDDETALRVGLMLITMGTEPPVSQEEARAGVVELATDLAGHV